jgi:uncharacterized protein YjbI with pentapeptide repeats
MQQSAELRQRWLTVDGQRLSSEVLGRLRKGKSLDRLGLGEHEGRIDLRGLPGPEVVKGREFEFGSNLVATELHGIVRLEKVRLEGLDFSSGQLPYLQIADSELTDCKFEEIKFEGLRLWGVRFEGGSFAGADLREAMLGSERSPCNFVGTTFRRTDLRRAFATSSSFEECDFSRARIAKSDYHAVTFKRCKFAGEINDVRFWAADWDRASPAVPQPHAMAGSDLSQTRLPWVAFNGIDLGDVALPQDKDHLIIRPFGNVHMRILELIRADESLPARLLRTHAEYALKWRRPEQEVGIWHLPDLLHDLSEEDLAFTKRVLQSALEGGGSDARLPT